MFSNTESCQIIEFLYVLLLIISLEVKPCYSANTEYLQVRGKTPLSIPKMQNYSCLLLSSSKIICLFKVKLRKPASAFQSNRVRSSKNYLLHNPNSLKYLVPLSCFLQNDRICFIDNSEQRSPQASSEVELFTDCLLLVQCKMTLSCTCLVFVPLF